MSHTVKTKTPFVDKKLLLKALDKLKIEYYEQNNRIIINNRQYYGNEYFILQNMKYQYIHDSYSNIREFLGEITNTYNNLYQELLEKIRKAEEELKKKIAEEKRKEEEERIRKELERLRKEQEEMEKKRLELIENNKKMIKEKAKKMGYKVKETTKNGKTKLVLVRRTY